MKRFKRFKVSDIDLNASNHIIEYEIYNNKQFNELDLSESEKSKWLQEAKKIVEFDNKCNNNSIFLCANKNFIHKNLIRDKKTKEIKIVNTYCQKMQFSKNYLIRQFSDNLLSLSLFKNQPDFIAPISEREANLENYLKTSIINKEIKPLYLYGNPGIGKTYKIISYCNDLITKLNKTVSYIYMPELIREIKNNFDRNYIFNDQLLQKAKKADLLVIDDFGSEYANSFFYSDFLLLVLNERCESKLPIIFISNLPFNNLESFLLRVFSNDKNKLQDIKNKNYFVERIMDRIKMVTNCSFSTYNSPTKRVKKNNIFNL